ncbi:MAG: PQQ-binding-like beta-propeller repeat protein, partial [Phycisphaerae bacterium]
MKNTAICLGLLVSLLSAGARADEDYLPREQLGDAKLVKYWQLQVDLSPGQVVDRAYLVDDQIYVCTNDGYAYAIHAPTGAVRWLQRITRAGYPVPRPCHADGKSVFVTPSEIFVLDKLFGDPVARKKLDFPGGSAGASDGNRVFCGGIDRRFYAFGVSDLFEDWAVLTEGPITSTPAIFRDYLYVASDDGRVYACNSANKRFQWRAETYAAITADLVAT